MIDSPNTMPFNFLAYGGSITGEEFGMRYRLKRVGAKPDFSLEAAAWPAPYCEDSTPEEQIRKESFPYSAEGREQALAWLHAQYEEHRDIWDHVQGILDVAPAKKA